MHRRREAVAKTAPIPPFEWQRGGERLHGIGYSIYRPCLGDELATLCGETITLTREDFRRHRRVPTCVACGDQWRAHLRRDRATKYPTDHRIR
ncbi:zinc finger protein [Actinokineospora sp.]|uniref:zinc finger protein n=1 Tax=Actinokineospora sp. TaxID=1872133 RepID=UPI00403820EE